MFWDSDPRFDLPSQAYLQIQFMSCVLTISGWLIILQSGHDPMWYQVFSPEPAYFLGQSAIAQNF